MHTFVDGNPPSESKSLLFFCFSLLTFYVVEIDILCCSMNSNATISMSESNFAKLVSIIDRLVKGDFGRFNADKWQYEENQEFIPTSYLKSLVLTLVS